MKTKTFFLASGLLAAALTAQAQSVPTIWAEKQVNLSDGLTLRYVEQGDPAGTPVVFLHGYSDSWHSYELVLPHLPPSVHAYALSQRGHGNSSKPAAGYHPDDFAADVAAFMDRLRIRQAVVVGHSMGGTVAQRFATRYPERLKALVLVGSVADMDKEPIRELSKVITTFTDPVDAGFIREFQRSTLHRAVPEAFFETAVRESQKLPAHTWKGVMTGLLDVNFIEKLKALRVPTLLVWGDQDLFALRDDQERLHAAVAGSKLLVYEGTGHAVHWEEPERFAKDLVEFLNLVSPEGAAMNGR
jgi:pimeloyl-ACP methyl ester carboxylesterase